MENKQFKKIFDKTAKQSGFTSNFGGWFKESSECIVTLDLQKSNYSNLYYLNIKVFIDGLFGKNYVISKQLIKRDSGNFFRRQPTQYNIVFDLESPLEDDEREQKLEELFHTFLSPISNKALTKAGVIELAKDEILPLMSGTKVALGL